MPSDKVEIRVKRLNNGAGLPLPVYASAGAAGMDICAAEAFTLKPGKRAAVPTGFAFAIPHDAGVLPGVLGTRRAEERRAIAYVCRGASCSAQ